MFVRQKKSLPLIHSLREDPEMSFHQCHRRSQQFEICPFTTRKSQRKNLGLPYTQNPGSKLQLYPFFYRKILFTDEAQVPIILLRQ